GRSLRRPPPRCARSPDATLFRSEAVGDQVEVLTDGGIRRGSDVVKALALGAKAVLVGRVWLWGLAAGGEDGVRQLLEILRAGIDESLIGLGHRSIHDLSPDDLVIPAGFTVPTMTAMTSVPGKK